MREYETTIIIQPEISEEGVGEFCTKLDGIVDAAGGVRLMFDDQGRRRLAFEIENFQKGRYVMLHFLDDGKLIPGLERSLRLEDSVLRFLTVQVSDEVADVEARKAEAAEEVRIREQKAAERAAREAEEAVARAAREAEAAAAAAVTAAAEAAAAEAAAEAEADASADETGSEAPAEGVEAGEASGAEAAPAEPSAETEGDDSVEKES